MKQLDMFVFLKREWGRSDDTTTRRGSISEQAPGLLTDHPNHHP